MSTFNNGVNNNWLRAKGGAIKLDKELNNYLATTNNTNTFGDFVVANAFTNSLGRFWKDVLFLVVQDQFNLNRAQIYRWFQGKGSPPDWFNDFILRQEAAINREALRESPSAEDHAVGYERLLSLGRSNIVAAHSYGTILANISYFGIDESHRPGHAIVAAALVDNDVSGAERFTPYRLPFTTIEEDLVVFITDAAALVKDANVNNYPGRLTSPNSDNGHGWEEDYLKPGTPARTRIMEDIVEMKRQIVPRPCQGHLISGGATTIDPISGNSADKQLSFTQNGNYVVHDQPAVPVLSNSGLPEKLIDWRGQFVSQEATRVLTFRGPAARYNGPTTYSSQIYRWGQLAYRTPLPVVGAAIQKDAQGDEYIVAATHTVSSASANNTAGNTVIVWRRKADLIDFNSQPYDAIFNKTGWERLLTFNLPNGVQVSPWFFNGSGTKAGTMRREVVSRFYGTDRRKDPICENTPSVTSYCNPGEFGDEFPAGSYDVTELRRFTLDVPLPGAAASSSVRSEPHEWGDSAIVAVDYHDQQELLLREENMIPRGFLQDPDPNGPADFKWLTLNGVPVFDQSDLNCNSASGVCRQQRSHGISRNLGGYFATLGDIEKDPSTRNAYHVFYSDLRTDTFAYSIQDGTGGETEYWVTHMGKKKLLGKGFVGSQSVLSYISARYDYAGDYRSWGYEDQYRDYTTLVLMDAEKINPILGRYEMTPTINIEISEPPVSFAFDVAADKSLLATGELASGTTFNFHSVIGDLDTYFPNTNLTGQTLLPISVR